MDNASVVAEEASSEGGDPPDEPPEKQTSVFEKLPSLLKQSFVSKNHKPSPVSLGNPCAGISGPSTHTPKTAASLRFLSNISLDLSSITRRSNQEQLDVSQEAKASAASTKCTTPPAQIASNEAKNVGQATTSAAEQLPVPGCPKSFEASFKFLTSISLTDEAERAPTLGKQDSAHSEAETLSDTLAAERFPCDSPRGQDHAAGGEAVKKRLRAPPAPLEVDNAALPPAAQAAPGGGGGGCVEGSPVLDAKRQQDSLDFLTGIALDPSPAPSPHLPPLSSSERPPVPLPRVSSGTWTRRELFGSSQSSLGSLEGAWGEGSVWQSARRLVSGFVLVEQRRGPRSARGAASPDASLDPAAKATRNSNSNSRALDAAARQLEAAAWGEREEGTGPESVWGGSPVGGVQVSRLSLSRAGSEGRASSSSGGASQGGRRRGRGERAQHVAVRAEGGLGATHLQGAGVYVCPRSTGASLRPPVGLFSVLKFRAEEGAGSGEAAGGQSAGSLRAWREGSYAGLLSGRAGGGEGPGEEAEYNPLFLDDPEIRVAKDRTVMKQESYVFSCIPFVKPHLVKEQLNQLFLAKHGDWIDASEMTLSKLRGLKGAMVEAVLAVEAEVATAALAHVLLEKLVLRNLVKKSSRKVTAAVCVVLAFKMNEVPRSPAVAAMQEGLDRQQPADASLVVWCRTQQGEARPLPSDLTARVHALRPHDEASSSSLRWRHSSERHYLVASFADSKAAAAARHAINGRPCGPDGHGLVGVAEFVPELGRGARRCSVSELLLALHAKLGVDRAAVLDQEFATFVELEMALHVPAEELLPHWRRILDSLDTTPNAYLGPDSPSLLEAEAACALPASH